MQKLLNYFIENYMKILLPSKKLKVLDKKNIWNVN